MSTGAIRTNHGMDLGGVLHIPGMQHDSLHVELAVQVHSCDDVLKGWNDALYSGDVLLFEGFGFD